MVDKKRRNVLFLIGLLVACFLVIGVSYALWQMTLTQTEKNVVTTGCFKVEFTDQNPITLDKAYPISDEEGKSLTPYEFTLTNTCDSEATYYINLETITTVDKKISEKYLKASLKKGENEVFLNNLNSSYINLDKVLHEASTAYKLYQGVLKSKEIVTFHLNLWLDEETPAIDEVMNATYEGKVTISTSYKEPEKNLMVAMEDILIYDSGGVNGTNGNNIYTQNGKYGTEKGQVKEIIYESEIHPYKNAEEIVDFSVNQDKSILGYYVKNATEDNYILYIQANGKIKVNPKASYYGYVYYSTLLDNDVKIRGIENLDTSLVTDMSYMFFNNVNDTLDLSHFNTSNVTNMNHMFTGMENLASLDLSHFDTSNVTDMSNMFTGLSGLTSLNLNHFDTSKVTLMRAMFSGMSGLTSLDLSHFDTSKVTNMGGMFSNMENLTQLNISNFDTRNVNYYGSEYQEYYHNGMFQNSSKLENIIYGDNFVYKNDAYVKNMYNNCPANKPTHPSWNGVSFE